MKKRRKNTKRKFNIKTILVSVFAVYFLFTFVNQQFQLTELDKNVKTLEKQVEKKQKELKSLNDNEEYYASDEYIEKTAREKLGLIRADETVFVDITGK